MRNSILGISELFRQRKLSPVELTNECLANIETLNSGLNAFITVTAETAIAQARDAEAEIQHGTWRGPLHGIPLGLKDVIDTAGIRTTAASALFKDRVPTQDAEVVSRLKNAGAVLLGKQNLHEFAYGGSCVISHYGAVRNPWDKRHITGGSSGGSAAAVAAGLCYGAIGTDTAGSIREPAALCGVVGFKPTYGRVSTRGVIPLSCSFDHVGPIARTVSDAAVILQAIAGYDGKDRNSVNRVGDDYLSALGEFPKAIKVGIPRKFFYEELDVEVASATEQALSVLTTMGAQIRELDVPVPTDRTLQSAESYAYHARFIASTPELYQPETLRRIRAGEKVTADEISERRRELQQIRNDIRKVFERVDLLVTPAIPIPAPNLAELQENPDLLRPRELVLLRNTRPCNVWGLPAISVPCGLTEAGLPIGLQIIGAPWKEVTVVQFAHAYEQATAWHTRSPQVASSQES